MNKSKFDEGISNIMNHLGCSETTDGGVGSGRRPHEGINGARRPNSSSTRTNSLHKSLFSRRLRGNA